MLPLWIDTDACHDDSLAILMASALPYFNLLGISTTYGSVSLENATRNANSLLTALQVISVHVYPGKEKPTVGLLPPQIPGSGLRGSGLLPLPLGPKQPDQSALSALSATIQHFPPQQVCIACLGSLTNLASLAVNHPTLIPLIDVISISAGVNNCNLEADPFATNIIMNLAEVVKPHVPPGSSTPQVLITPPQPELRLTPERLERIKRGLNLNKYTVFRQMMYELLTFYADNFSTEICDPVAVIALLPQRLGVYAGLDICSDGTVSVKEPEYLWKLILESIEELETGEL
ncbi:trifunctional uridine nucleosidase/nicotinamide riboside hydrolase/nicotinic acid riboside hydrolase [Starmerella bacillaris]|uniref:Trifunctional uridine nucleosidase/nicotinamide riboside hydrolase/nicotinic acid riboside hydrolase n=1 Tax=Starmerella bacillaris TaxID=1247836 RepID=A0AAV5RCG1_STABA|nr:trifunctional uridine nucleosidase/nicotinamide riboside hydrolase/nicotinic acid riboside hydrolase [Starmerella bacillaris]